MKVSKKLLIIPAIVVLGVLFFTVDCMLTRNDKDPVFAVQTSYLSDGGTKIYTGPGYKIIAYAVLPMDDGVVCKTGTWALRYDDDYPRYKIGDKYGTSEEYREYCENMKNRDE